MNLSRACDKAIEYGFYLLFFLVPLMMTPFNYELFEFNKMLLVYFLTTIIVAAWLTKMVVEKRLIFRRSFMDIPLIIFFVSQFLSFLVSIDRHTSLWGYYSRFHGGLISTIAYLLLYWTFVSNMDKRQALYAIRYTLISAALVSLYGIAEHFGIDAKYWVQDVKNRVFSSIGQPNWLAAWLIALLPIPMALLLEPEGVAKFISRQKERRLKSATPILYTLYLILILLFYICLLYTKSRSGLLGFAVASALFWTIIFLQAHAQKTAYARNCVKPFLIFTFSILLFTFLIGTPWTPNLSQILGKSPAPISSPLTSAPPVPGGGTESGEIRKIVWKGAIDVWRNWPIFGSGVETFAYSYYNFRPREHNDVSEWDFLYNRAHNEYLNFAATTGTVGLLAYLGMIGTFLIWGLRRVVSNEQNITSGLIIAFLAGYTSILITNFFGFMVVPVALFFYLFPAMAAVLVSHQSPTAKDRKIRQLTFKQWLVITIVLFAAAYSLLTILTFWYADFLFAKGDKLNKDKQYNLSLSYLERAAWLRANEPFYHDALSLSAANLASLAFEQNEATLAAELAELAITESDTVIKLNPNHLNFWKNRTRVFYALADIDEKYNQNAIETLLAAGEIAPTDAKIFYNLGLLYAQVGQDETAIKTLEKTIELKPNYRNARYALALFYEEKGDLKGAREQLESILEKIDPNDEVIKEKLESL